VTQSRPPLRRMARPTTRSHGPVTHREQVLQRRRVALMSLAILMPVTLVAALVTGSKMLLIANLVIDVIIGGYIAVLLRIKQTQAASPRGPRVDEDEDVKVVP